MKRIKLDEYDLRVAINGLYQMREKYPDEKRKSVNDVTLFLLELHEGLKRGRKKRFSFEIVQLQVIIGCLNDWRSSFIDAGDEDKAMSVSEVLIKFAR